ncbi:hypothetical protein P1X14_01715 [Sphingomonas sp. AOB5]|uniref:hypothetical protein n=1 Tax=Sphingomonas sp. AOB5 TaxID=3034017 RepID=UPI0023F6612E|nr:hypothetical protein [Sphingomonas sp. AOB5]MDF7773949.1 hypothetical protein [Sphingomonas sp. AOB5]
MAKRQSVPAPLLEWIAAGIGLILLMIVLGAIGREAITGAADEPPAITVTAGQVTQVSSGFVVAFEASNASRGTAAAVEIEGKLASGETSSATLDYVPGRGTTSGGLFFKADPRGQQVELRALGYQTP